MRLVSCSVQLIFSAESRLATPAEKIFMAITGKREKKVKRPREPGVELKDEEKRLGIDWFGEGLKIELENRQDKEACLKEILSWMKRINEVAPIGSIRSTEVVTFWIHPATEYSFLTLENKYRETMIVEHKNLTLGVSDSSVIFDMNTEVGKIHHQSGPMGKKQLLEEYLEYKLDDISDNLIFLWCSCKNQDMVKYSTEVMQVHLNKISEYCKSHADKFGALWEEVL